MMATDTRPSPKNPAVVQVKTNGVRKVSMKHNHNGTLNSHVGGYSPGASNGIRNVHGKSLAPNGPAQITQKRQREYGGQQDRYSQSAHSHPVQFHSVPGARRDGVYESHVPSLRDSRESIGMASAVVNVTPVNHPLFNIRQSGGDSRSSGNDVDTQSEVKKVSMAEMNISSGSYMFVESKFCNCVIPVLPLFDINHVVAKDKES